MIIIYYVTNCFRFEWGEKKLTPTFKQVKSEIKAKASGKAQVVFMWWDLIMDQEGDILLSCAPVWKHPDAKGMSHSYSFIIYKIIIYYSIIIFKLQIAWLQIAKDRMERIFAALGSRALCGQ